MTRGTLCLLLCLAPLWTACAEPEPVLDPTSRRTIALGDVIGSRQDEAHVWRGLPFAAPPSGDLRWRTPRPPEPWSGVREALAFGDACPQLDRSGSVTGSEDCLTLNVFAPAHPPHAVPGSTDRLPVMVFIHGGGQSIGSSHVYDGARLAAENGVVVVTVHYRLGILGWLSHPAFRARAATVEEASGNFATLDLVQALRWVQANIASFGGDPERVTIFGESAGAINVYSLLLSPASRGLFHRAISESGFPTTFSRTQAENATDDDEPGEAASSTEVLLAHLQRDGRAADRAAASAVLTDMSDDEVEGYLRGKSAEELLAIFAERAAAAGGMYVAPFVVRDGSVIPDRDPLESFSTGQYNRVPVVLGTNRDEHKLFLAFLSPHVRRWLGVPVGFHDAERYDKVAAYGSRLWKAAGADEPAAAMRGAQGPSVYGYRFDWDEQRRLLGVDAPRLYGAAHAVELLFVFGGTNSSFSQRFFVADEETAERLSAQMRSYWAQFAATGSPAAGQDGSLPPWQPWSPGEGDPRFMIFDSANDGGLRMSSESLTREGVFAGVADDEALSSPEQRCEIYQTFVQWSDVLSPAEYEALDEGACAAFPLSGRTAFD